jgi:multiple sugar transport system substrate-binding protein
LLAEAATSPPRPASGPDELDRAQRLPGEHQRLPAGQPGGRLHLVRGYRLRFFAAKGLIGDVSDIWPLDGIRTRSSGLTGDDGKQYFAPQSYYPWAVFYQVVWQIDGTRSQDLDEMVRWPRMQTDGIVPFAFGDKQGWRRWALRRCSTCDDGLTSIQLCPAGGHGPARGQEVFDTWRGLLPYHQPAPWAGTGRRRPVPATAQVRHVRARTFMNEQFRRRSAPTSTSSTTPSSTPTSAPTRSTRRSTALHVGQAEERGGREEAAEVRLLAGLAGGRGQGDQAAVHLGQREGGQGHYTPLQLKSAELVGQAKHIAQFLDRDTRPDFATTVMVPSCRRSSRTPTTSTGLLKSIERQKKSIFVD